MTDSYNQQNINLEGQTAFSSFIFDSSSAEQTDIIFNDWNALLSKLAEIPGIKQIIIPEGAPAKTIPAGTYDMTDIVLAGESPLSIVDITDVVFQNLQSISNLSLSTGSAVANTTPSFIYNDGTAHTLTLDGVTLLVGPLAAFPMIDISAATTLGITACVSSFLSANAGVPLIAVDATSTLTSSNFAGVQGNNWGGGPGSPAFVTVAGGGSFSLELGTGDIFWSTNNPAGPTALTFNDDYEEAVLADWGGVSPLNVKAALDRIAAAVGPIP